ncbi:putative helicase MOV-10 [Anopheles bellator]|uniref:putative helicase MOV-10 n=1 Tax=Anopheles bellator TaxID=139047 RepID=UPI0026484333|nr:putative helicase MOV-10 [Anopheles bellator]
MTLRQNESNRAQSDQNGEARTEVVVQTRCLHKWNETMVRLPQSRQEVKVTQPVFNLTGGYNIANSILTMCVQNLCQQVLILRTIYLYYDRTKRIKLFDGIIRMVPGFEYEGDQKIPQHPECTGGGYTVVCLAEISPTKIRLREISSIHILKPRVPRGDPLALRKTSFFLSDDVKEVYRNQLLANNHYSRPAKLWLEKFNRYKTQGLLPNNYVEYLRMLDQIQEIDDETELATYTIPKARLIPSDFSSLYWISVTQFPVPPVRLTVGDHVKALNFAFDRRGVTQADAVRGIIWECSTSMTIKTERSLDIGRRVRLEFPLNRVPFLLEYQALNRLSCIDIPNVLFPQGENTTNEPLVEPIEQFTWFDSRIATNRLQQGAIKNIVNRTAFPAPYIIFGPPGTGKTCTIVEAVLQIYKTRPNSRILVTATSNYACNELTKRLLKYVAVADIFRYFSAAKERDINQIDADILYISNLHTGKFEFPCMNDFLQTRILVATVITSGRLLSLRVCTKIYNYIFIDECGSSKELSALVPIGCVGVDQMARRMQASVVLAGDPQQLGPVTHCQLLTDTVHSESLLDRLMRMPFYGRNAVNAYNTKVVTKLLDNYRSHPSLFQFSNEQFYEGELRAKAHTATSHWAIGWDMLPNPEFPLMFHSVVGNMIQDQCTLSYMNKDEAFLALQYAQLLMGGSVNGKILSQSEIGILTPYSSQVAYIKNGLALLGLEDIEVGSAEQYQGREKAVMIVSTVRSHRSTVGFLADTRRLNVTMTRAKALMIIIGNEDNLSQDPTWKKLLSFIISNKGLRSKQRQHNFPYKNAPYGKGKKAQRAQVN